MKYKWLWLSPLILLLIVTAGLLFLLATPPGTRFVFSQAATRVPGLTIGRVEGTILGGVDLKGIGYRQAGTDLSIDRLSLEWHPARLLQRTLHVKALSIDGVVYRQGREKTPPLSSEETTLPSFDLPLNIVVEKGAAKNISIDRGGEVTALDAVLLSGTADGTGLHLQALQVDAPAFQIDMKGAVRNAAAPPTADYRFNIEAALTGPALPAAQLQMEGAAGATALQIGALRITTLGGEINGEGKIAWQPVLRWEAALTGDRLQPGSQWPEWKGALTFALASNGEMAAAGPVGEIRLSHLKGTLRGYPVSAQAALALQEENYLLRQLTMNAGSASLNAEGKVTDRWDLTWKIQAPDLAALWPGAEGSLAGSGTVAGPRLQPKGAAALRGDRLALEDQRIKKVALSVQIDLQDQVTSHVRLKAEGVQAGGQKISAARLDAEGKISDHRLEADIQTAGQRLRVRLEGRHDGNRWEGTLHRADIDDQTAGAWRLEKAVAIQATLGGGEKKGADAPPPPSVRVEEGCWIAVGSPAGRLCGAGRWEETAGWQAEAHAQKLPFALLQPFLPADFSLAGTVDAEGSGIGGNDRMEVHAKVVPSAGTIRYRPAEGEEIAVGYREGLFQADLKEGRLQATAKLTLIGQGAFQAEVGLSPVIPGEDLGNSRLEGKIDLQLTQLGLLTALTPMIEESKGRIALHAALGGTFKTPEVKGEATLHQGSARVPSLGIHLRALQLVVESNGGEMLALRGGAKSGPGSIQIGGSVTLDANAGWPMRLTLKGDRFQILDTHEARVLASPDLTLALQKPKISLTGEVLIPEAALTVKELPKEAVQVSDDTVIVREEAGGKGDRDGREEAPWEISSNVMIRLGEKVTFAGFGLTAQITGNLRAIDAPGQVTTGEGQLQIVNGLYAAYGQKLNIAEGRLNFAGPISNPGLDIRATRKAEQEEVIAGIQVRGTLQTPETTLFSEPPMDQAEALSYLLLGRPLNQASSSEGDFLTKAISALGLKGGDFLAKKIGRRLGLDEVKIESGENVEEATLVVGRYFSPKFYVSYGIGLFESINTLHVRYKINRLLTLQGESGDETGMDLIYTKEYR